MSQTLMHCPCGQLQCLTPATIYVVANHFNNLRRVKANQAADDRMPGDEENEEDEGDEEREEKEEKEGKDGEEEQNDEVNEQEDEDDHGEDDHGAEHVEAAFEDVREFTQLLSEVIANKGANQAAITRILVGLHN